MENSKNASLSKLVPVMLCFFVMGFVDLVGIASNYVKADLNLTDSQANIFPSLVFFWFLIFSVPTGMLMNRWRQLSVDACFIFSVGHWKCLDADFSESTAFNDCQW